ncbi:uncharacterized protein LOC124414450, partial [Diprion similis]|uniref:uncharacterized protein LOC124414450 n=1 Tax=Diprion similis TaxID=362088 RepID=UPI001EF7AD85
YSDASANLEKGNTTLRCVLLCISRGLKRSPDIRATLLVVMKFILRLFLLSSVVYCQKATFIELPALDAGYHVHVGEQFISEMECIKKLDGVLKARWTEDLVQVPTEYLGNLPTIPWEDKESIYTRYNTLEDEWLIEGGSPEKKISQCIKKIVSDVRVPLTNQGELDCVAKLISTHTIDETYHQRNFEDLVNTSSAEQLPFRKFISFPEIVDLIFQNRQPSSWTNLERLLYAHTMGYVLTDADRNRRNYFTTQNCDWVNLKALREAPSEVSKLNEFSSQVRHAVNKQLAGKLVKNWNLNEILSTDRYELWTKTRQNMTMMLEREVERLRNEKRDPQWLCEYATELATYFTEMQSNILLTEELQPIRLESSDLASRSRRIEEALSGLNNTRHSLIRNRVKNIADEQENGTRCLSAFLRLVQNHRRYQLASAFIDEAYVYPEIFCKSGIKNPGLIQFTFCNCVGTFCVSHSLAALFAEEYVLVKGSDGIYKVVRSGIKSQRKVTHCHTLGNSNRN